MGHQQLSGSRQVRLLTCWPGDPLSPHCPEHHHVSVYYNRRLTAFGNKDICHWQFKQHSNSCHCNVPTIVIVTADRRHNKGLITSLRVYKDHCSATAHSHCQHPASKPDLHGNINHRALASHLTWSIRTHIPTHLGPGLLSTNVSVFHSSPTPTSSSSPLLSEATNLQRRSLNPNPDSPNPNHHHGQLPPHAGAGVRHQQAGL